MTTLSPRETFDRNLRKLMDDVLVLGSMVQEAVLASVEALKRRDHTAARQIYHNDQRINEKRYAIENECLTLIATQQPMARDLRFLAAIFEINTELERIGDYAKGISRINIMLGDQPLIKPLIDIPKMAQIASEMLQSSLDAFVHYDIEAARTIPLRDPEVDQLYNQVYHELVHIMVHDPSTETIDQANYLMWAAHNLERMADRVTNICERIIFVITGEMKEMDVQDDL